MKYILNIFCADEDIKKSWLLIDEKFEEDVVDALNRVLNYNTQDHWWGESFSGITKCSASLESIMTEDEVLGNIQLAVNTANNMDAVGTQKVIPVAEALIKHNQQFKIYQRLNSNIISPHRIGFCRD